MTVAGDCVVAGSDCGSGVWGDAADVYCGLLPETAEACG